MKEFVIKDVWVSIILAWFIAQMVLKVMISSYKKNKLFLRAAFMGGGMPSGHTALVSSLSMAVGLNQGFKSIMFIVTIVFSLLVVYEVLHTKKAIADFLEVISEKHPNKKVLDELGHTLKEVIAGAVIGIIVVAIMYQL